MHTMTEEFVIQSDLALLPLVEERLVVFCGGCNVGDYHAAVSVAAMQAVENAIVHGNNCDPGKEVRVECGTCKGGVYVEVSDQGRGFDHARFGSLPESALESGEGIFVMHRLADKVEYSDGGRRVRMEFMMRGIDPELSSSRVAVLRRAMPKVEA